MKKVWIFKTNINKTKEIIKNTILDLTSFESLEEDITICNNIKTIFQVYEKFSLPLFNRIALSILLIGYDKGQNTKVVVLTSGGGTATYVKFNLRTEFDFLDKLEKEFNKYI